MRYDRGSQNQDLNGRLGTIAAANARYHLSWSDFDVPGFFLHACARSDHSVSKIIIFKSAAGSISFRSTVSQSCSIHACVGGLRPRGGRASAVTMAMPAAGCCLPCATSGGHPTRHSGVP